MKLVAIGEYLNFHNAALPAVNIENISKERILDNISTYYRLWSRQLLREFHAICYQYSLVLDPPVFAISASRKHLGSWRSGIREIRMSSRLILDHPWDVTLQVLKHEMAHQICSEIFHDDSGGHGENFLKACERLGLPERFRRSQGDLSPAVEEDKNDNRGDPVSRNIIEKIRKLLALAESSNEHESALAMEMAGRLLRRYNVREHDQQNNYVYSIINRKRKRIEGYQRRIILILTKYFYVDALSSSLYDPLSNETHKTFEIFGKKENVEIAEYCYHFLEKKLSSLWQQNCASFNGNKRIAKKSYYLGLLQGFRDKLSAQENSGSYPPLNPFPSEPSTSSEMMVVADAALKQFVHARYPRISNRSMGNARIYRETYDQGVTIGRTLVIHKGITGTADNDGKLLECVKASGM